MPVFYFEINEERKGWLRIEAPTLEEAREDVKENGFDASDIVGSEYHTDVTFEEEGGEEID